MNNFMSSINKIGITFSNSSNNYSSGENYFHAAIFSLTPDQLLHLATERRERSHFHALYAAKA